MKGKTQWEQEPSPESGTSMLDQTLEQYLSQASMLLSVLTAASLAGGTSTLMKSGGSLQPLPGAELALFWALRATAALSALRSWKANKEYVITLPMRGLLASYTLGAQLAMEAHASLYAAYLLMDVFEGQHSKPSAH